MRIFFQDVHGALTESIARVLRSFNAVLLLGDASFSSLIDGAACHTRESIKTYGPNVQSVSFKELTDAPPDIVLLSCCDVEKSILKNVWPSLQRKSKLVMYEGNNYSPARRYGAAPYVVTSDAVTWKRCAREKQTLLFYPPCDYDRYCWQGPSDSNRIGCYINRYSELFPADFAFSKDIQSLLGRKNRELAFHDYCPWEQVPLLMRESCGTLHVKPLEGYGFTLIESMASGRPVFLYGPYSLLKSYRNWCVAEQTAVYFTSKDELLEKFERFYSDHDYRHRLQENAARAVRALIDFKEQAENLKNYFHYVLDDDRTNSLFTFTMAHTGSSAEYPAALWKKIEDVSVESDRAVSGKIARKKRIFRIQIPLYAGRAFVMSYFFKGRVFRGVSGFADSVFDALFVFYNYLKLSALNNPETDKKNEEINRR